MSYGTIKIDTITFTDGGIDKSVSVSGLTQNPTFSGNITVTGTISGNTIQGVTVSGVTGTFTSGVFASGTAAAPSVSIGTTDNGLYSPGTDQLAISTNGSGRLFVDASGRVGVGAAPSARFEVSTTAGTEARITSTVDNNADLTFYTNGVIRGLVEGNALGLTLGTTGSLPTTFVTNNTERLRLTSDGKLGLGTSSPNATLQIGSGSGGGNVPATSKLMFGANNSIITFLSANDASSIDGEIGAWNTVYNHQNSKIVFDKNANNTGQLLFFTQGGTGITERLRITSGGNVGIGTTTVDAKLQIVDTGTAQIRVGYDTASNFAKIGRNSGGEYEISLHEGGSIFRIQTADTANTPVTALTVDRYQRVGIGTTTVARGPLHLNASADTQLHMTNSTTGTSDGDGFTIAVSGSEALLVQRESAPLSFYTASTERARIDSSGRLLVGTSSSRSVAATVGSRLQVEHQASAGVHGLSVVDTNDSAQIAFGTNNGGSVCADGKLLARINFSGNDGTDMQNQSAWIEAYADATWGNDDVPGRLVFSTTADGANSPTERMRISSDGSVSISTGGSGFSTLFRYGANEDNFISQGASGNTVFRNHNNSEYARIDSSGRLGLGTSSPGSLLDVNGQLRVRGDNNDRNPGSVFLTSGGQFTIIPGSGATSFAINDSGNTVSRFVIDSSGNVGIGTTSPSNTLQVGATTSASSTSPVSMSLGGQYTPDASITYSNLKLKVYDAGTDAGGFTAGQTNGLCAVSPANSPITFITQASDSTLTERMRITSDGGCDHFNTNSDPGLQVANSQGAGASYQAIQVRHSATTFDTGTVSFLVFTNGNVQNTNNSYGAISDAKLKENIVDASSQWNDLKALQVRNYNFKPETNQQTHTQIGLIAQEVELVSPGLVSESPDRDEDGNDLGTVTKSVNYSVLYMKAVKALQEAMERIEILEASNANLVARVTALEAQ